MKMLNGMIGREASGGMVGREARAQYAAMAQLRCRMFVNGLRTIHGLFDLGATGISWLFYSMMGLGLGLGLYAAARGIASSGSWQYLPILFWAVSLLWVVFPILVTSFQEQADLGILLRFPVRFGSYFVLHLISGVTDISTFVGALCCLGVWLGIVVARPDLYLWATLCLLVFAGFNILLTRAVFAWIERWLAQRKTREILGAVFMVLFVGLFVGNSLLHQKHFEGAERQRGEAALFHEVQSRYGPELKVANRMEQWLPPGLAARSLQEDVRQRPGAGLAALGLLGLWGVVAGGALAGRLKAQYRGQNLSSASSRDKATRRGGGWTLGGSRPYAGLVEKEIRCLMRTLPLLWALCVPTLFVVVLAGFFHHGNFRDMRSFPFVFLLSVAYAVLGCTGMLYNSLGAEGAGIQLLFLSPTPIRTVFLAKNLLHAVLFVLVGFVAGGLVCLRLGVPPVVVLADTGAWLVFALPCNLAAGVILSMTMPYRINPGRIARQAGAQANTLPAMLIQAGVLGVGALVFWLCWNLKDRWLPVPILLALAAGAFFVWTRVLHFSSDNANQRRDTLIATVMKAG